jgi:ATPase subunit of ABC transporter with duplicated ATPase domains
MRTVGTLAARHIAKSHGAHVVLEDVSLVVPPRARIGVVGPNGIGKSTLLRLLARLEEPDTGSVERSPATLTVGYLPQEADTQPGETLYEYLARRTGVAEAAAGMDSLAARLSNEPELAGRYSEALDHFLALGGDDLEARARAVCADVGLPAERLRMPVVAFSGGQAARAALAAILLSRFDVLLLDEPTNDLDFAGLELLEQFLDSTLAALVIVSHDRALLDRCVTRIVELEEGSSGSREWAGGFSAYEAARERARRGEYEAFEQYVGERERIEEQYRRRREWIDRAGVRRRKKKTRDVAGNFERRLRRLERADKPFEPWQLRLALRPNERSSDVVASLEGAVVERGSFRLGPVDLELRWRDRLAILGPNGSGKTTLLHALLGRLPLTAGRRRLGAGIVAGELEQGRESFTREETLLAVYRDVVGLTNDADARTTLAKFGLGAEHVVRSTASLSPGERTRAALASYMARGVNLLLLDEPTNHLDLEAIEQLENALAGYEGTAVVISHDRRFLERFAPTQTLPLTAA